MNYENPRPIDKVEAFELCGGILPTKRIERLIVGSKWEGTQVIFKKDGLFYIADLIETPTQESPRPAQKK